MSNTPAPVVHKATPNAPPAIWRAFVQQGRWKSWVIVLLFGVVLLQALGIIALARRPPEYILVDAQTGDTTLIKHSVSNDALLRFLAEKTKPPKVSIVRFTREFLHLALAVNSSTIQAAWPAALAQMSPGLRQRLDAEAKQSKLLETYKAAQRKTDLNFESIDLVDRTDSLLAVRAVMTRKISPLLPTMPGSITEDRIQIEMVEEIVTPTVEHPDGLQVVEWRLSKLTPEGAVAPAAANTTPSAAAAPAAARGSNAP